MSLTALVSIVGPDHIGLVSAVSSRLFDLGANLGDTAFTVLGGGAEFSVICEFTTEMDLETLQSELEALDVVKDAVVVVSQFELNSNHPASQTITHMITVSGGDTPGLMARLCEVFEQFDANIVRLNSERIPGVDNTQYVISVAVAIPLQSIDSCLATISNTTGELGLLYKCVNVKD